MRWLPAGVGGGGAQEERRARHRRRCSYTTHLFLCKKTTTTTLCPSLSTQNTHVRVHTTLCRPRYGARDHRESERRGPPPLLVSESGASIPDARPRAPASRRRRARPSRPPPSPDDALYIIFEN